MKQDNVYVGLDIGTTKVCAVIVKKNADDSLDVIGVGKAPSVGLRKGVVINIDATVNSIVEAVKEAEKVSGVQVKSVCAGIAGGHIKSFNSRGIIAVKNREVTAKDVDRVIESASAVDIPLGSEVLHVIPQQYILDGQSEIKDPIGMNGIRLEVDVHIVTGAVSSAKNILKSCERANISVDDIVLEQLASSAAVVQQIWPYLKEGLFVIQRFCNLVGTILQEIYLLGLILLSLKLKNLKNNMALSGFLQLPMRLLMCLQLEAGHLAKYQNLY
jgi:cell division protein FtsA